MTQEQKELLFKDLSARLPYGVKCEVYNCIGVLDEVTTFYGVGITYSNGQDTTCRIDECKPYLFPVSNINDNEELRKEFDGLIELELKAINDEITPEQATEFEVDFYNKHHLDWRGLIPMGLAIDATNLNIY